VGAQKLLGPRGVKYLNTGLRTAIDLYGFGVLLHWCRYWFGTALLLRTVSFRLKLQ
jgi:hypothetical protein